MRAVLTIALVVGSTGVAWPDDIVPTVQKRVSDALYEVHEKGAKVYNDGDFDGGYRIYQGGLTVARRMLVDRPDIQKTITDGMAAADRLPTAIRRGFQLHELIETVRGELLKPGPKSTEHLTIPPRTVDPAKKPVAKPAGTVAEVKDGVVGRVVWQGAPLTGVDVTFVTLGRREPRVFETTTGAQGVYTIAGLPAGKYVVLITAGAGALKKLPERYATSMTSPLMFEVKGTGEKLDFVLQ
jgi:Carboxypeptidase regulatory-like domain